MGEGTLADVLMIVLEAIDLHWIRGLDDDSEDQCAHGSVRFEVNDTVFVRPEDVDCTVSAAALFLLRTLEHDHTPERSVARNGQLFPCCGHAVWPDAEGRFGVMCVACSFGVDLEVRREGSNVHIVAEDGRRETVTREQWASAVHSFAYQVRGFYDRSTPKRRLEDDLDREGWALFWKEWEERLPPG